MDRSVLKGRTFFGLLLFLGLTILGPFYSQAEGDSPNYQELFERLLHARTFEEALPIASQIVPIRIWDERAAEQFGEQYVLSEQELRLIEDLDNYLRIPPKQHAFFHPAIGIVIRGQNYFRFEILIHEILHAIVAKIMPAAFQKEVRNTKRRVGDPTSEQECIGAISSIIEECFNFVLEENNFSKEYMDSLHDPLSKDRQSFWDRMRFLDEMPNYLKEAYKWDNARVRKLMEDIITHIQNTLPNSVYQGDVIAEALRLAQERCNNIVEDPEVKKQNPYAYIIKECLAEVRESLIKLGWLNAKGLSIAFERGAARGSEALNIPNATGEATRDAKEEGKEERPKEKIRRGSRGERGARK